MEPNISARILADSINPSGVRLTSWLLRYPRFIHAEFMTHRVFSRNAASSRAIPFEKMLAAVRENPARPEFWGAEKGGMQTGEEIEHPIIAAKMIELLGAVVARQVEDLKGQYGFHKAIANRYIEPWSHITIIATATDHRNFFGLRANPAAERTFQKLAYLMLGLYLSNQPEKAQWGDWHIPTFEGTSNFDDSMNIEKLLKVATARCARLSYLTFDRVFNPEKDIELHDKLAASGHWSPFEHCARADDGEADAPDQERPASHWSNFDQGAWSGWFQYRKLFPQEDGSKTNLEEIYNNRPEWLK